MSQDNEEQTVQAVENAPASLVCSNCSTDERNLNYQMHGDRCFCTDCYSELFSDCADCEEEFWRSDMVLIEESLHCEACVERLFSRCSACEEYVPNSRSCYSEVHHEYYCEDCFNHSVAYCERCDDQIDADSTRTNEAGETLCEDCWERGDDSQQEGYLELFSETFERCISQRKYGIEIEALLEEGSGHLAQEKAGFWKQMQDGSLGEAGREYVSPIFHGDLGFIEIEKFTAVLKEWGYFVKRQCGLHVHIDGRDLTCEHIKVLLKITRYYEPVLYAMLPPSRYQGTYSVPLENFPKSRFRIPIRDEDALKRLWYGTSGATVNLKSKYHHSRYYGLNIHSWFFRRSLEFRYHSGTLCPQKIINFIMICQAFVDKAKETKHFRTVPPSDFHQHFESFVSFLGLAPELALYIRQRILKFHPDRFAHPAASHA